MLCNTCLERHKRDSRLVGAEMGSVQTSNPPLLTIDFFCDDQASKKLRKDKKNLVHAVVSVDGRYAYI